MSKMFFFGDKNVHFVCFFYEIVKKIARWTFFCAKNVCVKEFFSKFALNKYL